MWIFYCDSQTHRHPKQLPLCSSDVCRQSCRHKQTPVQSLIHRYQLSCQRLYTETLWLQAAKEGQSCLTKMVCTLCPVPSNTLTSYVYARQLYRDAAGLAHQPMRRSLPVELRKGILCAAQPNKQQLDVKVKAAADDILTPVATQLGDIHTATSQLLHAHQVGFCQLRT